MNFRKTKKAALPAFQMTSMMDVVFLLLCFFVATSVFSQWEYEVKIALPSAKSGMVPDRLPGEVILNVDAQGVVTLNGFVLDEEQLLAKLTQLVKLYPGQPVVIRGDRNTRYEDLMKVIDCCRRADIWNFSMATRDESKKTAE